MRGETGRLRTLLVALIVTALGARAVGAAPELLWDQASPAGPGWAPSADFASDFDAYDCQAADDFVVPAGSIWSIERVEAYGDYAGESTASTVEVVVFSESRESPGVEVFRVTGLAPTADAAGDLVIDLPVLVELPAGAYWLSVRAAIDAGPKEAWLWSDRGEPSRFAYLWRNPGDGYQTRCTSWSPAESCLDIGSPEAPDLRFRIFGHLVTTPSCNAATETFATGVPPAGWSVVSNADDVVPDLNWTTLALCGEAANYTGGDGETACVSSGVAGPYNLMDTELRSAALGLVGAQSASLRFRANYQNYEDYLDTLWVDLSPDGGSTWANLLTWDESHGGHFALPGETVEVDLGPYLGRAGLIVRWRYAKFTINAVLYAQVDDVRFGCMPFRDGFESGDTSRWSGTTSAP